LRFLNRETWDKEVGNVHIDGNFVRCFETEEWVEKH
jgi:hypothetical protein